MKKFIAYIFLLIFSFQVLPVKEIGSILFKGQMTEEIHETADDSPPGSKIKKESDTKIFAKYETVASVIHFTKIVELTLHRSEHLPRHFVPDILTPPPNFI
ncbi:hypothetical protein [Polluticoccus soli]|uniref:hypothetical protein n=1 Tax=Polluticoccus soli TaxID=3034150 RepID=UPI0023E34491|nr:hypothetical protein [Flavipsychrobacter sp. JY13-12]